jgi:hypothetical protein
MGVVMFETCTFKLPFRHSHDTSISPVPDLPDDFPKVLNELLKK